MVRCEKRTGRITAHGQSARRLRMKKQRTCGHDTGDLHEGLCELMAGQYRDKETTAINARSIL